jgi:FAD/FMN-containing dehydrogenase
VAARRKAIELADELRRLLGQERVADDLETLSTYASDRTENPKGDPAVVVWPQSADEIRAILALANRTVTGVVPRVAGLNIGGLTIPARGAIVLDPTRMNRILEIDLPNCVAIVEPGVINLDVTKAVAKHGLFYAPDPSSQAACSIGGNVANNSGGPHTLAYGVTTNHVLGVEVELYVPAERRDALRDALDHRGIGRAAQVRDEVEPHAARASRVQPLELAVRDLGPGDGNQRGAAGGARGFGVDPARAFARDETIDV